MADDTTTTEAPADAPATEASPAPVEDSTIPASEVEKWKSLARKHEAQAKANADAAKRLSEIEDAQKSEQQRLTERAEAAEKAAAAATAQLLRLEVAQSKGLSPALAARLTGETKEELEADAEAMLAEIPKLTPGKASDALVGTRTPPASAEDVDQVAARIFASG